ncbi:cation transporter [Hyphobacterium sp. CCMP332]|nr:cation transporter [Hyphobacterium sp. CCMP332]
MYKSILFFILGLFITINSYSQDKKIIETAFNVSGVCEMCKARIENAALLNGVKKVNWDKNSQTLHIIYRKDKVELMDIHKAVAAAGHDTSELKANDEAYKKIPACCSYKDGVKVH